MHSVPMNRFHLFATIVVLALASNASENPPPATARDLADHLGKLQQDGASYVRLKMVVNGGTEATMQIQIKQRRIPSVTEVVYQVLWPKERKGESILLRKTQATPANGFTFVPPNTLRPIADMKESLFGSDLSYEDVVENFFLWDRQELSVNGVVNGVNCAILVSTPGKADHSTYGSVRSWIDLRRSVPLRVEKYSVSGHLLRRIETTRVVANGGRFIPAGLVVHGSKQDSTTEFDGSRIKRDVNFTDAEFTGEGIKQLSLPHGSPE